MKKLLLALTGLALYCQVLTAQESPKREFRGAWVASYFGIDWPNRSQTPAQQRDAFINLINHHQQSGITALFVQVRSQSDALYPSQIEPWGFYLTPLKTDGNVPSEAWDPMQFMIDECRKRGMEFHAWLNPYRAIGNISNSRWFSPEHVARKHPEYFLKSTATEKILDPGLPQVRERINNVVMEIVNNYDVDGIHFDDYFYPNAAFNDDSTFALYNRGFTVRADWRRDNVNLLIQAVSQNIKAVKPWVEFGVSPSGIWRNGGEGSATGGLQHYVSLYADSRKWLQEGWIDYLCPQVYWYIGQPGADYKVLIPWWNNNAYGRLIYIGMAGYKVGTTNNGAIWQNDRTQIPSQIRMNRSAAYPNIHGQAIYNTSSMRSNPLGFRDSIRQQFYNVPALQPSMPWIDATPPAQASNLSATYTNGEVTLTWNNPPETAEEMDKVKQLVIYRSENPVADLQDANNILAITPTAVFSYTDETVEEGKVYYYQVTALDRLHNESTPTNTALICTSVPQIVDLTTTVNFCETSAATYTIPAITATSNCVALTYSYTITGATTRAGTGNDASGAFALGISTINWTVTDEAGNSSTGQTVVTINPNPVATIGDAQALPSGTVANTVYLGYAPAGSLTLEAQVTGGTAPYNYSWSSGAASATAAVSPTATTTYLFTVTDANGCVATAEKQVNVVDVRAGRNGDKVSICHQSIGQSTIEIEGQDVPDHLMHGDMLGACAINVAAASQDQLLMVERSLGKLLIKAYPNPSTHYFTLQIQGAKASDLVDVSVTDMMGRLVEQHSNLPANKTLRIGEKYRNGIYFIEVSSGAEKNQLKLVKQ